VEHRSERHRAHRSPAPQANEDRVRRSAPPTGREPADDPSADETRADAARRDLREHGFVSIQPDERIGVILAPGEAIAAVRRSVSLERRLAPDASGGRRPIGDLYVTTERLIHLGRDRVEYGLGEISDAVETDGALRLIVGEGRGVELGVADPRLLRVEIAAMREAARAGPSG